VSQLRILNGIEFQVVAAECLKARDATDLVGLVADSKRQSCKAFTVLSFRAEMVQETSPTA